MNDLHRHRKNHLLMELRIAFGWRQPILRQKMRVVEIDRLVELAACRIDINDFEILVDRTDLKLVFPGFFPRQCDGCVGISDRAQRIRRLRIEGIYAQLARGR
ncbi:MULTISPECIES: hypothetical protein [unclassified Bradyrhizobium]|uniref:hypothetical protein n=1 Tax=unclassified Bradyrhizobium TaxID=2631580 RepID=UPI002FEFE08A